MKNTKICFYNNVIREHEECRNALRLDLFKCQSPLINIECKESTADLLMKVIKKLNQNNIWLDIVYNESEIKINAWNESIKTSKILKK